MSHVTARLRLEPLAETHASVMLPVLSDERMYTYMQEPRYACEEELAKRYRRLAAGSSDADEVWWNFIVFPRDSSVPMGFVQATLMLKEQLSEVAYVFSPNHWGNGYATEALIWLLQQIRQRGDLPLVQAQIDMRNSASIAVVQRLGFDFSRTVIEDGGTDGVFQRTLNDFNPGDHAHPSD